MPHALATLTIKTPFLPYFKSQKTWIWKMVMEGFIGNARTCTQFLVHSCASRSLKVDAPQISQTANSSSSTSRYPKMRTIAVGSNGTIMRCPQRTTFNARSRSLKVPLIFQPWTHDQVVRPPSILQLRHGLVTFRSSREYDYDRSAHRASS
ncbi:hypothetical protein R1flu_024286 [Riccia fluitans]|uniref:Uncharacterized protein n=1 Tax=Riccia fluitans TaxID=41844 RepID=A0ABD1XUI3_9MARC